MTPRGLYILWRTYANIVSDFLPPVALFDPSSAKIDNVIDRFANVLPIELLGHKA